MRTALGWERKFDQLCKSYSNYTQKLQVSGCDEDSEDLYCKPPFFEQLHELETRKARHSPPGDMCTVPNPLSDGGTRTGSMAISSRKRARNDTGSVSKELDRAAAEHHDVRLEHLKESQKENKRLVDIMERC